MAQTIERIKAQAAWDRIEALGGHGVWESDIVVVSLANTEVLDDDLALFRDFPYVQILDLSQTKITELGLAHLVDLPVLEEIILIGTQISLQALGEFARAHAGVKVRTKPPQSTINPFGL